MNNAVTNMIWLKKEEIHQSLGCFTWFIGQSVLSISSDLLNGAKSEFCLLPAYSVSSALWRRVLTQQWYVWQFIKVIHLWTIIILTFNFCKGLVNHSIHEDTGNTDLHHPYLSLTFLMPKQQQNLPIKNCS